MLFVEHHTKYSKLKFVFNNSIFSFM